MTKHKKSIEKLKSAGLLNGVQYVLLPVASKKPIYLAVLGDFLNAETFHKTTFRIHMQLIGGYAPAGSDFPPWELCEEVVFDYWTTTMVANTWEELYHILHMAITNCMVENIQQSVVIGATHASGGFSGPTYYHRIKEMNIHCFNGEGQDIVEPFDYSWEYPFESIDIDEIDRLDPPPPPDEYTSGNAQLCEVLAERYGIYHSSVIRGEMTIREREDGELTWRTEKGPINLFSDVKKVIFGTGDTFSPFMMLTDDEYDQLIRIDCADVYLIPLIYAPDEYQKANPAYDLLTPTTYYKIPRYEFNDDNDSPQSFQFAIQMLDSYMGETIESYDLHEPHEIAFMIAYMQDLMEAICEACKVEAADRLKTTDLLGLSSWCTVMIDVILEVSEATPTNKYLHIMTDRYQDTPVDIKTVCYLLEQEERTH